MNNQRDRTSWRRLNWEDSKNQKERHELEPRTRRVQEQTEVNTERRCWWCRNAVCGADTVWTGPSERQPPDHCRTAALDRQTSCRLRATRRVIETRPCWYDPSSWLASRTDHRTVHTHGPTTTTNSSLSLILSSIVFLFLSDCRHGSWSSTELSGHWRLLVLVSCALSWRLTTLSFLVHDKLFYRIV